MNKKILERYATLKVEIKKLETELEYLQPEVLKEISAVYVDKPVTTDELKDIGTFSITKKKKWQYSEELMDMKVKVTEREQKEKQDGTATFEEQEILVFKEVTK